jgi:hypothetical protein
MYLPMGCSFRIEGKILTYGLPDMFAHSISQFSPANASIPHIPSNQNPKEHENVMSCVSASSERIIGLI